MGNELATTRQLTPQQWDMITAIAPTMHTAHYFGVASPEQAAAIMLKGYELGLSLTSSFEFVQVIQGKPTLSPRGALALILQSPACAGVKIEETPDSCTVTMKRSNGFEYTTTFTLDDARRAGLVKPDSGWEKYPANMLRWRAVGYCADVVFPDVIGGMKRADEFGADLTPAGDVVDAWVTEIKPPSPTDTPTEPALPDLSDLVTQYGADAVMAANGGQIPATAEDVARVAEVLNGA